MTTESTPNLDRLMARINRVTKPRGKKAELARFFGVPTPRVSEWLKERRRPNGETSLRLLEWVTAEEAKQQKSPGSATNTTRAKTRLKASNHENPKSDP